MPGEGHPASHQHIAFQSRRRFPGSQGINTSRGKGAGSGTRVGRKQWYCGSICLLIRLYSFQRPDFEKPGIVVFRPRQQPLGPNLYIFFAQTNPVAQRPDPAFRRRRINCTQKCPFNKCFPLHICGPCHLLAEAHRLSTSCHACTCRGAQTRRLTLQGRRGAHL